MDAEVLKAMLNQFGMNTAIIAAVISFAVSTIVSMFVIWFQKKLQASLDTKIHVSKIQFDVEYKAYQEIWNSLIEVRNALLSFRPRYDVSQVSKSERIQIFGTKYNQFSDLVEKNKPFYTPVVYHELFRIREAMYSEGIDYQYGNSKREEDYWTVAKENKELILNLMDSTSDAIRLRIASITIVD